MNLPLRLCEVMGNLRSDYGLSDMQQPLLREVFEVWCGLRGDHPIPPVSALDPVHFLRFSSNLIVCDVLEDGDIEFRIAGEAITSVHGATLRGMRISSIMSRMGDNPSVRQYLDAVGEVRPNYYDGPAYIFDKTYLRCQRVLLPFVDSRGLCRKLLGALVFDSATFIARDDGASDL